MITAGTKAPNFSLKNQDDKEVSKIIHPDVLKKPVISPSRLKITKN